MQNFFDILDQNLKSSEDKTIKSPDWLKSIYLISAGWNYDANATLVYKTVSMVFINSRIVF